VPEVWVGFVEVRQLPGENHPIALTGKGAFTWIACWTVDAESFRARVGKVMNEYGLFVVDAEEITTYTKAEEDGIVGAELADLYERTRVNENYCIYGTLHNYFQDQ